MRKNYLALIASMAVFLTSCGSANVAGKHFENDRMPFSVDFSASDNKVFYIADVGNYSVEKNDILINLNGRTIKLLLKGKALYIYEFDEVGNQTDKINEDGIIFYEDGESDFFTNYFVNTKKTVDNAEINFTDSSASIGQVEVFYNFNSDTGKYELEGFEPTYNRKQFLNNVFDSLIEKSLNRTNSAYSTLTYEKAWWLRKKVNDASISDTLISAYLKSFYSNEYSAAKNDEFAMHRLEEKIKPEITQKFNSVNKKEIFSIVQPTKLEEYDFSSKAFSVDSSCLSIPELSSTLLGDKKDITVRLGNYSNREGYRTLLEGFSKLSLPMDSDKAEELKNRNVSNCIIIFDVEPYLYKSFREMLNETDYELNFTIKSIELLDAKTLENLGSVNASQRF